MRPNKTKSRDLLIEILVIIFGVSSWVAVRGLWVELPIMIETLPEGWNLASYIVITSQLANIGPVLFGFARRCYSQKVLEIPAIHATMFIGVSSSVLLAFFWSKTSTIGGVQYSTALIILTFFLSAIDCTSSVLYLPFMANFREQYVIMYLVGQGMSGLLPSLVAFAQGAGGDAECRNSTDGSLEPYYEPPRFSAMTFYFILALMIMASWIAFILLNVLQRAKKEWVNLPPVVCVSNPAVKDDFPNSLSQSNSLSNSTGMAQSSQLLKKEKMQVHKYIALLAIQTFICFLQNSQLSIQTFSCLPYGNLAYHLTINLSNVASPLGSFIAVFVAVKSLVSISVLTALISAFTAYIFATAAMSPFPPLVNFASGAVLVVSSWLFVVTATAYTKAVIASVLRKEGNNSALFWCGAVTQFGSAAGALVSFLLVNVGQFFHSKPVC